MTATGSPSSGYRGNACSGSGLRSRGCRRWGSEALTQHPSERKLVLAPGRFARSARSARPLSVPQITPVPFSILLGPRRQAKRHGSTWSSAPPSSPFPKGVGRVSLHPVGCSALAVPDSLPPLSRPGLKLPIATWAPRAGCVRARLCLGTLPPAAPEFVLAGPDRSVRVVSGPKPRSNLSGKGLEQAMVPPQAQQPCFSQSWEVWHPFRLIQCWPRAGRASTP